MRTAFAGGSVEDGSHDVEAHLFFAGALGFFFSRIMLAPLGGLDCTRWDLGKTRHDDGGGKD